MIMEPSFGQFKPGDTVKVAGQLKTVANTFTRASYKCVQFTDGSWDYVSRCELVNGKAILPNVYVVVRTTDGKWNPSLNPKRHGTHAEAVAEAKRLAEVAPKECFTVIQVGKTYQAKVTVEIIES